MPDTVLSQCVEGHHQACPVQVDAEELLWVCTCGCHPDSEEEDDHEWERFTYDRDRGFPDD